MSKDDKKINKQQYAAYSLGTWNEQRRQENKYATICSVQSWHHGMSKDDKKINMQQYAAYCLGIME